MLEEVADFQTRVDGHGPCIIHEVSISEVIPRPPPTDSAKLKDLLRQKERVEKALYRCQKSIDSVNTFQSSANVQHVAAKDLRNLQQGVESVSEELDTKLSELEQQVEQLTAEIDEEKKALGEVKTDDDLLRQRISITVSAEKDCEAGIILIYGACFQSISWQLGY